MWIVPAIDLLNRNAVRLSQGKEDSAVIYSEDPVSVAKTFESAGAKWLHIVDLDAAFGRPKVNTSLIQSIRNQTSLWIQLGGGIRSNERIAFWLQNGIQRVVLGSIAVKSPELVKKTVETYGPHAIAVGIDIQNQKLAIHGWKETSTDDPLSFAQKMENLGVRKAVITEIVTDGMLTGPKVENSLSIIQNTTLSIWISGGIGSLEHIDSIFSLQEPKIEGVIVGKALYEKCFLLEEAIERFQQNT